MGLNENGPSVPKIQIFHPTLDEMKDFSAYIHKIEEMGANKAGLAKVINFNLMQSKSIRKKERKKERVRKSNQKYDAI